MGFSASTGNDTELNCIRLWEFSGSNIGDNDLKLLWIIAPATVVLVLSGIVFYLYWQRKQAIRTCSRSISRARRPDQRVLYGSTEIPTERAEKSNKQLQPEEQAWKRWLRNSL